MSADDALKRVLAYADTLPPLSPADVRRYEDGIVTSRCFASFGEQHEHARDSCGVTPQTFALFARAGIHPEPYSPMQGLMICYDDAGDDVLREELLRVAKQINALTPFACCAMKDEP